MTSADELADWERTAIDGYPLSELRDAPVAAFAPPTLLGDERLHFFIARDASGPVAAAASFSSHGIASLAFSATLPRRAARDSGNDSPSSACGRRRTSGRPACSAITAGPAPSRSASCRSCA